MDFTSTISSMVIENPALVELFETLRIDYCCGGDKTLFEACQENNLSIDKTMDLIKELNPKQNENDFRTLPPDKLCDHIEQTHHKYVRELLPRINQWLNKMVSSHGTKYLPLLEAFQDFSEELLEHMEKEEKVIFPLIRQNKTNEIQDLCLDLRKEHEKTGEKLQFFRKFTSNYEDTSCNCVTELLALKGLLDLEKDMHLHVFKENSLLFPKTS